MLSADVWPVSVTTRLLRSRSWSARSLGDCSSGVGFLADLLTVASVLDQMLLSYDRPGSTSFRAKTVSDGKAVIPLQSFRNKTIDVWLSLVVYHVKNGNKVT